MTISAKIVKELRDKTGAGMMDCKNALKETNGDLEKAVDHLRKSGIAKAEKKGERTAKEGFNIFLLIASKITVAPNELPNKMYSLSIIL